MFVERRPGPALAPWVSRLWVARERPAGRTAPLRERMVPTGGVHLVLRLDDTRIRIFDGLADERGRSFTAVIGGARASFHVRQASAGACSIGMQIRPGAAGVILGVPGHELAGRHTALEDVWGTDARELRERLCELPSPTRQLAVL